MSELLARLPDDDLRVARGAAGRLGELNRLGVFTAADVHVARVLGLRSNESDERVLLAVALVVRALRRSSVCLDLADIVANPLELERPSAADETLFASPDQLGWPALDDWCAAIAASELVAAGVVRIEGSMVYLDRYWREEQQIVDDLAARMRRRPPEVDHAVIGHAVERIFPGDGYAEKRETIAAAAEQWTTVVTGGPGTGKTTAAAGLLALVAEQHEIVAGRRPRVALAAPTARAAARLQEAIGEVTAAMSSQDRDRLGSLRATTLHRLLGWVPDSSVRFKHNRSRPLPFDIVVVDEASMVSLNLMARLLEALRSETRLVLLGDPGQLASVEAGAVLAHIVDGFEGSESSPVIELKTVHRFAGGVRELADALRAADAERVVAVFEAGHDDVELIDPADAEAMASVRRDAVESALTLRRTAEHGDVVGALSALSAHRLLCAHRDGPYGVSGWNRQIERWAEEVTGVATYAEWYPGRPILVTTNDRGLGVDNGDLGVTVRDNDGRLRVYIDRPDEALAVATSRLSDVSTVYAMTVHKAQGSQAREVTVVLPPPESPLLTRELFYTAVTRAVQRVRVIGTPDSVRAAVMRDVPRASGLADKLRHRSR